MQHITHEASNSKILEGVCANTMNIEQDLPARYSLNKEKAEEAERLKKFDYKRPCGSKIEVKSS